MPELPEVEIMCRNLARWCGGRTVGAVELIDPRLVKDHPDLNPVVGLVVGEVRRRGKYATVHLADPRVDQADGPTAAREWVLVLHFRMTGKVVLDDGAAGRRVRLRLHLKGSGPPTVVFDDRRCLGEVWLIENADLEMFFTSRKLGPEPWPMPRGGAWWSGRLKGSRGPLKTVLMDQHRVAGLGNIAASEILWLARLSPFDTASDLALADWDRLADSVPRFIDRVLQTESGDEVYFVQHGGSNNFAVYQRADQPCLRCATPVARRVQSGRSTFWCPECQPERPH